MAEISDHTILQMARNAGLASSQYDFSRLLGRSRSYYSCIASKRLMLSVAALGIMASKLKQMIGASEQGEQRQQLRALRGIVLEEIERRCDARAG